MIYTSGTLSLAALEYFVHLDPGEAPADLTGIPADIPDTVSRHEIRIEGLPENWRSHPAPGRLAELGSEWVRSGRTAVLVVPSAVVPREPNYLLSPTHRDFRRIRVGTPEPFGFDPRMWKR
jgi:RES domain-containing protein